MRVILRCFRIFPAVFATDLAHLATITDPLGRTTTRTYEAVSRLSTQTDPLGRLTWHTDDLLKRLSMIADRLQKLTRFTYDANGDPPTVRNVLGQTGASFASARGRAGSGSVGGPNTPRSRGGRVPGVLAMGALRWHRVSVYTHICSRGTRGRRRATTPSTG
jgi:YD repeat-containing protein